jgi:hypothetical protein
MMGRREITSLCKAVSDAGGATEESVEPPAQGAAESRFQWAQENAKFATDLDI